MPPTQPDVWFSLPLIAWGIPAFGFIYYRYLVALSDDGTPTPWRFTAPLLISVAGMSVIAAWCYIEGEVVTNSASVTMWATTIGIQSLLLVVTAFGVSWNATHRSSNSP